MFDYSFDKYIIKKTEKLNHSSLNNAFFQNSLSTLGYCYEGYGILKIHDSNYNIGEGNIFYIPKNSFYYLTTKNLKTIIINYDCDDFRSKEFVFQVPRPTFFYSLFNDLYDCYEQNSKTVFGNLSIFYRIIYHLEDDYYKREKNDMEIALANIGFRICDSNLSIVDLAETAKMSVSHFEREFKKQYGISPVKYINRLRINRATGLLKNGVLNVQQVAYDCGFENVKYFSTLYKKLTGNSPSSVRNKK